jgi:fumarylacetoacetate (FAA) hydrolase family protein
MGTQSDEKPMGDIEILIEQSLKDKEIIHEYWALASQQTLTQQQAERIEEILQLAEFDPWLDFLIDEVDHILAHELGLIREPIIQHQLQELKKSLDRFWCEQVIQEVQKQNRSKEIQKYLQSKGLYDGLIDGYIGPRTRTALELYKQEFQVDCKTTNCFNLRTGLVC